MTTAQKIKCPKCGESISIDDALTHDLEDKLRKELEGKQKVKEAEIADEKKKLELEKSQLETDKKNAQVEITKKVNEKIATERVTLWKQAQSEAGKEKEAEKKMLEEQLAEKDRKLRTAQEKELEIRKEKNKLEEEKKNFELEKQRQLDEERSKIREQTAKHIAEEHRLKDAEKDKKLSDALLMNDELKRKLQQGSQQTQGEVSELELEELLRKSFPHDTIEPVPKGINGADIIQKVFSVSGSDCGSIAWESKHTKSWSEPWIAKLKEDQRKINADVAVIISEVLPKDIKSFACREGVWITDYNSALGLAMALRMQLIQVSTIKLSSVGKNEKMEVLYKYLSGTEFKHKVEAIVEAFVAMKKDLDSEKRSTTRLWAKREKQIEQVINNTARMYGDMQGLLGSAIQPIPALEAGENLPEEENEKDKSNDTKEEEINPEEIPF